MLSGSTGADHFVFARGGNTVITLDVTTHITLANVAVAQLPSTDFAFT